MTGNAPDLPRVRRRRRASTARCSTSTTPTASASSASAARRDLALRQRAATASSATSARPTTTSSSSAASRRPTRRCWPSSPARPSSRTCSRSPRRPTCTPGPSPVASLATVLAGLRRQRAPRRRAARRAVPAHTARVLRRLDEPRRPHAQPLGPADHRDPAARPHADRRRRAAACSTAASTSTLAAYPLVPKDEVGFRIQLTAANTDAEVDLLIDALERAGRSAASCSTPRADRRPGAGGMTSACRASSRSGGSRSG